MPSTCNHCSKSRELMIIIQCIKSKLRMWAAMEVNVNINFTAGNKVNVLIFPQLKSAQCF